MGHGRILIAAAALLIAWSLPARAATVEINPDVETIENGLERRIQDNLKTFLGEDAKIIATVRVKETFPEKPTVPSGDRVDQGIDVLYAPIPYLNTPVQESANARKSILIRAVEADVQVGSDTLELNDATMIAAKDVVTKTLKGFTTTIQISKLAAQPKRSPAAALAQSPASTLMSDPKTFLPFLSTLIAALLLMTGIIVIALSLRSSSRSLVKGLTTIFVNTHSVDHDDKAITLNSKLETSVGETKPGTQANPLDQANVQRNVLHIRETLAQNPMLFVRTLKSGEAELRGIKWLLPNLSSEEQQSLRSYLGRIGLHRLNDLDRMTGSPTGWDAVAWLQDFVERLMLKKIEERSIVEKALGPDKSGKLHLADSRDLIQVIRSLNTPAAWRILSEFISKDSLDKLIAEMAPSEWAPLFEAAELDANTLASTANEILTEIANLPKVNADHSERSSFYSRTLLDPVLLSLSKKEFGQEDAFLDQLGQQAPELVTMVRERFWPPSVLTRVPDDVLIPILRDLKNEQRVAILMALPQKHSDRMIALLPPGNVRTIAADQVMRARSRKDPFELKIATSAARQFIENLRKSHVEGRFQLLPERQNNDAENAPEMTSAA